MLIRIRDRLHDAETCPQLILNKIFVQCSDLEDWNKSHQLQVRPLGFLKQGCRKYADDGKKE